MSGSKVEVLIPIYKPMFDDDEQFAVDRTFKILGDHSIEFFGPDNLSLEYYVRRYQRARFRFFEKKYFESIRGYNQLLVSKKFYEAYEKTEFVLIVQPDVYIFRDDLNDWVSRTYDYVAAPWPRGITLNINLGKLENVGLGGTYTAYVGNGGFSLRRVLKCKQLIDEHSDIASWFNETGSNEDLFFAFMGGLSADFDIPNQITASHFAMELESEKLLALNGEKLPMGVHAYKKYSPDLWQRLISNSG